VLKEKNTMKKYLRPLIVMIMLAAMVLPASSAFAASTVNAGGVPEGSVLVLNITYKVTNDEDSGNVGYWALDSYNKQLQVWQVPDGSFYAIARYEGKWQTFEGALSPGAGVAFTMDGSGTFKGGYVATFDSETFTSAFGNIGTYDFGGTEADVLLGSYGSGQTGAPTAFDALGTYFPGYSSFTYKSWGWTYRYQDQRWFNFDTGTSGDIVF
jgi:hypothetical protein